MAADDAAPSDALSLSEALLSSTSAGCSAGAGCCVRKTGSGQTCSSSAALLGGAEVPSASPTVLPSRNATSMSLHHASDVTSHAHRNMARDMLTQHACRRQSLHTSAHYGMTLHAVVVFTGLPGWLGYGS